MSELGLARRRRFAGKCGGPVGSSIGLSLFSKFFIGLRQQAVDCRVVRLQFGRFLKLSDRLVWFARLEPGMSDIEASIAAGI